MTLRLTPAMVTALRTGRSPIAPLIAVDLPGYALRHLVGSAEVVWGSDIYRGRDPVFGAITAAGNLRDGVGDEAPDWSLTWAPPNEVVAGSLSAAEMQGSPVRGWLAVIDRATGAIVPDPVQVFSGKLDQARLRIGKGTRTVEFSCSSALDVFHDNAEGARLSDAWHQLIFPGETGLANMTGIERVSYWGVELPPSNISRSPTGVIGSLFK